jgi:hypothetical protein
MESVVDGINIEAMRIHDIHIVLKETKGDDIIFIC